MRIYLLRHGESEGNRDMKFRGRSDYVLTERGRHQAECAGRYLEGTEFDAVFSSPLKRAFETAAIVSKYLNCEVQSDEAFNNIELGVWEGKKKDEIRERYPEEWKVWISEPEKLIIDGMESLNDVIRRTATAAENIRKSYTGNVLIVTHRAVIKPMIADMIGIREPYFWKIHTGNAAVNILEWREPTGWILNNLNINHYLEHVEEENV